MEFIVRPTEGKHAPAEGRSVGYLWTDKWDDWFKYSTMYYFTYFDREGQKHEIGSIKIGQFNWEARQRRPKIPERFESLGDEYFSLGQDIDYYTALMEIAEDEREAIFAALRDVVSDEILYAQALNEEVMTDSLMRSVSARNVEIQYRAILNEGVELTPYKFDYVAPPTSGDLTDPIRLEFDVEPGSSPPTNIHVLVGRNGVGKTRLLNGMTKALVDPNTRRQRDGQFVFDDPDLGLLGDSSERFANLVSVTFSAFDDFLSIDRAPKKQKAIIEYTNVGLRKRVKKGDKYVITTQNPERLSSDFANSALNCSRGIRGRRWKRALTTLETDSLFGEIEVAQLADIDNEDEFAEEARALYKKLSSGHKIVLLSMTKLVELVEERSLVLMDEPEAHLHPPLLSAFIRALSDLLNNRNGVAIIATHSPVVVQEVPASCVWKVSRHGVSSRADRPEIETFAETVSVLTREIFGLEVDRSGFHKMIGEVVDQHDDFDNVIAQFDEEIGSQGQALIRAMLARRNRQGDD